MPPRYRLAFRVDPVDRTDETAFRRQLYARFGLKLFSVAWAEIDLLGWPRLREFVDAIDDLERRGVARAGSGILTECLPPDEADRCDWFQIKTDAWADIEREPYPAIRADRVPAGRHVLQDGRFVSERFKTAVESSGLSGIEFLWIEDRGKFRAAQWYVPIASAWIGRGVEHPWSLPRRGRQRVWQFDGRALRAGWTTGVAAADRLLSKFPMDSALGLIIQMVPRVSRADLPDADFAYASDPDVERLGAPRVRPLFVSARARRALAAAGALAESDLLPTLVVDARPDEEAPIQPASAAPPPMFTPAERLRLRAEERRRRAIFDRRQRPERRPTQARSLALLRAARKTRPADFGKCAATSALAAVESALLTKLPSEWADVLRIADGGRLGRGDDDWRIVPLAELAAFHGGLVANGRATDDDYPANYLNVASNASGDYIAVDLDADRAAREGAVAFFDHETLQIARRWESVAAFLDAILAG